MFRSTSSSSQYNVHLPFPLLDWPAGGRTWATHFSSRCVLCNGFRQDWNISSGKGFSLNKKVNHTHTHKKKSFRKYLKLTRLTRSFPTRVNKENLQRGCSARPEQLPGRNQISCLPRDLAQLRHLLTGCAVCSRSPDFVSCHPYRSRFWLYRHLKESFLLLQGTLFLLSNPNKSPWFPQVVVWSVVGSLSGVSTCVLCIPRSFVT